MDKNLIGMKFSGYTVNRRVWNQSYFKSGASLQMWHIVVFQICFCIGNDMSRVHGSVDLFVDGGLPGLPWTRGNGGRGGSSELGV
jgi:hypothetical protein